MWWCRSIDIDTNIALAYVMCFHASNYNSRCGAYIRDVTRRSHPWYMWIYMCHWIRTGHDGTFTQVLTQTWHRWIALNEFPCASLVYVSDMGSASYLRWIQAFNVSSLHWYAIDLTIVDSCYKNTESVITTSRRPEILGLYTRLSLDKVTVLGLHIPV